MKKIKIVLAAAFLFFLLDSCKEKTTNTPEPAKTLNKALLLDKTWYAQSGHKHIFNSNGKYKTNGTWNWLNNGDSLAIQEIPNDPI